MAGYGIPQTDIARLVTDEGIDPNRSQMPARAGPSIHRSSRRPSTHVAAGACPADVRNLETAKPAPGTICRQHTQILTASFDLLLRMRGSVLPSSARGLDQDQPPTSLTVRAA